MVPSHIPTPALSHISAHIKIPNVFLQSSSIGLLPVIVSSPKKPTRSCVTIKKMTQNPTLWPLVTPRHAPSGQIFAHCILLFITFDLICNMTMFVQNGVWTFQGHTMLALPPGVTSKFRMCFSSPHPKGYHLWKFRDSSLNGLGAMVCHYRRTDGWTGDITGGSQVDLRQHTM